METFEGEVIYTAITCAWSYKGGRTFVTVHNTTESEAIRRAIDAGWKPPRWWQFWKAKSPIEFRYIQ